MAVFIVCKDDPLAMVAHDRSSCHAETGVTRGGDLLLHSCTIIDKSAMQRVVSLHAGNMPHQKLSGQQQELPTFSPFLMNHGSGRPESSK